MQPVALMALAAVSGTVMGIVTDQWSVVRWGHSLQADVVIKIMMLMTAKLVVRETSKRFHLVFCNLNPPAVEGLFYSSHSNLCLI